MRFIARTQKIGVITSIHVKFVRVESWMLPRARALVTLTAFVSGRKTCANICRISGKVVNGKNVPLKRNMGVMNRKPG